MFVPITHPLETLQQLPDAIGADELLERSYLADLPFTLEQLRTLKAIAIEGSFVRAADRLYLSQPTVSLQVQNLERHLGISLFHRTKRQAQLTEAGQVLVNYGDHILTLCQETCRVLKDLQNLQGGTLVVGASQTPGNYLMPRLIDLFRQKYPGVAVQLHVYSTCQTCWSVMNGQLDLAIVEGEIPVELQDSLKVISYTEDELVLVTPAYHPLAQIGSIQKADLYQLQFIALDSQSTTRKVIDQKLARCGIDNQRLKLSMELNSIESIKNAVQEGLGVAFVSTLAIEKELQLGTLCRVHVEDVVIKRVVSAIFSLNSYYSKAAETFSREILPKFATLEMAKALSNPVHFVDLD